MPSINSIKEEQIVVRSVGSFASSLQQIAASRMVKLRRLVEQSRRFVEEATLILRELELERTKMLESELEVTKHQLTHTGKSLPKDTELSTAIIVATSNQGLSGSYNVDIVKKVESVIPTHPHADYFIIGKKGQEYFANRAKKLNIRFYPYTVPEVVTIEDLRPLISMFYHYDQIYMIYSKYINTANREVVFLELAIPHIKETEIQKELVEGSFIFEPDLSLIIRSVTHKLRYALFRQQILDSKLSLYTAQMMAMKTASDNAQDLLKELRLAYNKARRKLIDKKIQEVQAGRVLWEEA